MDEETKKKYELLKKKNRMYIKEKYISDHVLFQECMQCIGSHTIINEDRHAEIWIWLTSMLPFSYVGHILWDAVVYNNFSFSQAEIPDCCELEKNCFLFWSNAQLPGVFCKMKSIFDNFNDVSAVDFYAWLIPEDFSYIIELDSGGNLHIAILK